MASLAQLFLADRREFQALLANPRKDGAGDRSSERFKLIEKSFNEEEDRTELERQIAAIVLRAADCAVRSGAAAPPEQVAHPVPESNRAALVLSTAIISLTLVLIVGVLTGEKAFTVILASMVGGLGYGAASGRLSSIMTRWPLSLLLGTGKNGGAGERRAEDERAMRRSAAINELLRNVEEALRATDGLLTIMRKEALETQAAPPRGHERSEIQFLQDLAEAAAAGDGDHALMLAERRLRPLAASLGLTLVEASNDTLHYFSVDVVNDGSVSQLQTLRPAVLEGENCIARGYARRRA